MCEKFVILTCAMISYSINLLHCMNSIIMIILQNYFICYLHKRICNFICISQIVMQNMIIVRDTFGNISESIVRVSGFNIEQLRQSILNIYWHFMLAFYWSYFFLLFLLLFFVPIFSYFSIKSSYFSYFSITEVNSRNMIMLWVDSLQWKLFKQWNKQKQI
jgi:hypothetical protein